MSYLNAKIPTITTYIYGTIPTNPTCLYTKIANAYLLLLQEGNLQHESDFHLRWIQNHNKKIIPALYLVALLIPFTEVETD